MSRIPTLCAALSAEWVAPLAAQATAASPSSAVVRGIVYDSVSRAPLARAMVQLVADDSATPPSSAFTDSLGRFEIDGVPPGRYLAGFFHEAQDALAVRQRVHRVELAPGDTLDLTLTTPSGAAVHAAHCRTQAKRDSAGLVVGFVRDAETNLPLERSSVVLMWPELVLAGTSARREVRQVTARSDADGWFAVCGVPSDGEVTMRAESGPDSSGFVALTVPPRGTVRQNLRIGRANIDIPVAVDSSNGRASFIVKRGTARLEGRVLAANGAPAANAQLSLWASDAATVTDAEGRFALASLPAGTYTLEARLIGFHPTRVAVQLARDSTTNVVVSIDQRVPVLEAVTVYGKRRPNALSRVLERRERGMGQFITREEIERAHAFTTTDLLRTVRGVRVVPTGSIGYAVLMRGGCLPTLIVDGIRYARLEDQQFVMPRPDEVAIIEVYVGSETPVEFSAGGCGAVVVWTRLGG